MREIIFKLLSMTVLRKIKINNVIEIVGVKCIETHI